MVTTRNGPTRGVERGFRIGVRSCFTVVQGRCVSSSDTATAAGCAPVRDRTIAPKRMCAEGKVVHYLGG